jgi:hypothetical protein
MASPIGRGTSTTAAAVGYGPDARAESRPNARMLTRAEEREMNSRRSILGAAAAVLLLASAVGARAQLDELKGTTPEQRARAQSAFMKTKLGLSAEQLPKVEALNLKYANEMEPVISGSSGPLMKMRQAKEINERKEADLKGLLSPDQFQKYLASKEEMRDKILSEMKNRAP